MFAWITYAAGVGGSSGGFGAMAPATRLRILSAIGASSINVDKILFAFIHVQATMIGPTFMITMERLLGQTP
jgi:hypothetical protein